MYLKGGIIYIQMVICFIDKTYKNWNDILFYGSSRSVRTVVMSIEDCLDHRNCCRVTTYENGQHHFLVWDW